MGVRLHVRRGAILFALVGLVGSALPARAQETRADELAKQQAQKSTQLKPYTPTGAERAIQTAERILATPPTIYPWLGSVLAGGLFAAGPGLRVPYAGTGLVDGHAAWSLKNYKVVAARLKLPEFAGRRVTVDLHADWIDAPKVAFYGVGNGSAKGNLTSFLYRPTTAGLGVRVKPLPLFRVGGTLDYLKVETGSGTSGLSIEERFTPGNTPGLGADPTYTRGHVFAEIDWREFPGYSTRGGLYRIDVFDYLQRSDGPFSFRRVDAEVRQLIPILRANWVIGLRALASMTYTDEGKEVPYFLMPDLGGGSELRGYPSWRFRDRNRLLLTAEYRWTPSHFLDMALFYDAGKVTARRADLDLDAMKTSYGIGARFHTPTATVLRIELARTREGTGLVWGFSQIF